MMMNASDSGPDSMLRRVPGILAYLVHVDSLLAMAGLAIIFSLLEWVGSLPGKLTFMALPAARLLWGAYFFLVARKAAIGKLRLPVPSDLRDTRDALIKPIMQAGLATTWYWLALLISVHATVGMTEFIVRFRNQPVDVIWSEWNQGVVGYGILALGMVYLPTALVAALVSRRLLPLLDPTAGFRLVQRVLRCYTATFGVLTLLTVIGFTLDLLARYLVAALPIPLAAPVIRYLMRLWVPLAQARLLGGFVFHNRSYLEGFTVDTRSSFER